MSSLKTPPRRNERTRNENVNYVPQNGRSGSSPQSSSRPSGEMDVSALSNTFVKESKEQNVLERNELQEPLPNTQLTTNRQRPKGRAVTIVSIDTDQNHELHLNETALEKILRKVQDIPVAVISIAGAFRTGKSFLLSYMLRYLQAEYKNVWIGDENMPLTGFEWGGGSKKVTSGILLWSEPFFVRSANGEKVAILLMDTQGTYEVGAPFKDSVSVFCLSILMSSVQVFNIMKRVQENNVEELQYFAKYGEFLREKSINVKPYQKLLFLIRDWNYPDERAYGEEGGELYLQEDVVLLENLSQEQRQTRERILSCFEDVSCFLMPYPGRDIETNKNLKDVGQVRDMPPAFKEQLQNLVSSLLDPENLILKKIGGSKMTGRSWCEMFKAYVERFKGNELPSPSTLFQDTVLTGIQFAMRKAKDWYDDKMSLLLTQEGATATLMNDINLLAQKRAFEIYEESEILEKGQIFLRYGEILQKHLSKKFESYALLISHVEENEKQEKKLKALQKKYEEYAAQSKRKEESLRKEKNSAVAVKKVLVATSVGVVGIVGAAAMVLISVLARA